MNLEAEILAARILIVDDEPANVLLLNRVLSDAGYTNLSSCEDPQRVEALHRETPFDLILLDVQMPQMDGFAVIDALRPHEAGGYLPVIVLTAQPAHKLRALKAGAKDFISKPFDLTEVLLRIRNMLEVRMLYRQLESHNLMLDRLVEARTAELAQSEARYRSLTELASDWYWEQDAGGVFVRQAGPVMEMLGLTENDSGWDPTERQTLQSHITMRRPFLDFIFHRTQQDGSRKQYRVSGEPVFDSACRFQGYRGIGVEITAGKQ